MNRIKKKLLAMTLGAVFTFASFSSAFAADPSNYFNVAAGSPADGSVAPRVEWQEGSPGAATGPVVILNRVGKFDRNIMKEALADLVTAGTITQAQSDAVLTYFQNKAPEKPVIKVTPPSDGEISLNGPNPVVKFNDPLKDLVDEGTITQDQARAISDKMQDIADQRMQQRWQTCLDTLVSKGTFTQDQAGKVLDFLAANKQEMRNAQERAREDMQNMREQTRDMSPQERTRYLKQNLQNLAGIKDPVSQMVDQGIITQQQADAVRGALAGGGPVVFFSKSSIAPDDSEN